MCHCLQLNTRYTTITTCSLCFSYNYSLLAHTLSHKQQHLLVRSVKRRSSNHDYSLHTQRIFAQKWLSCYCSWLFIVLRKQSDERSWSGMFIFLFSRELYGDFIVACVFCSHCLLLHSLNCLSPSLMLMLLLVYL